MGKSYARPRRSEKSFWILSPQGVSLLTGPGKMQENPACKSIPAGSKAAMPGLRRRDQEADPGGHSPASQPSVEGGGVSSPGPFPRPLPSPPAPPQHPNLDTSGFSDHRPSRDQPLCPLTPPPSSLRHNLRPPLQSPAPRPGAGPAPSHLRGGRRGPGERWQ